MPENAKTLEKSPLLDLAQHVAAHGPAMMEEAHHMGAEVAHHVGQLAAGGAVAIAAHHVAEKAGHALASHFSKTTAPVTHVEGSGVVGHHYNIKGKTHVVAMSTEHGLRLNHVPGKGEKQQHFQSVSHEDFKAGLKSGRIKDTEPGSGPRAHWFGKSEDGSEGEPLEKSPLMELAHHLVAHGPEILHHAQAVAGEIAHHSAGIMTASAGAGAAAGAAKGVREAAASIAGHAHYSVPVQHVEGSAHTGNHYLIGGHRYKAVHSDSEGVHFDPHPTAQDKSKYGPVGLTHKEISTHMRSGHVQDLSDGGAHEKSEIEATDIIKAEETAAEIVEATAFEDETTKEEDVAKSAPIQVGDVATDWRMEEFQVTGIDRGIVELQRSGNPAASMSQNDWLRFIKIPGHHLVRDGKRIVLS